MKNSIGSRLTKITSIMTLILLAVIFIILLFFSMKLGNALRFQVLDEGNVQQVVCDMVKPEYLKQPCK